MIKGKTQSGFEFEISKNVLNDYELLEDMGQIESNPVLLTTVVRKVLGDKQTEKLKDHVRSETGKVQIDRMSEEITDIFTNSGEETKNS